MKFNKWTVALAAVGVVSLASAVRADEHLSQVQTALSNTTISGYVDVSAQWNLGNQNGTESKYPAYAYGGLWGKADGFNLNGVDIALNKPMDESQWASGYRVELMIGPDSPMYGGEYGGAALRQAYITLRTPVGNGIDWKVGVFDSPLGYESTSDPLNPNYTRSYGYTIEPTTLTGILATYKVNDVVALQAGIADTWSGYNGRSDRESEKTYLADIALTAPDSWGWIKGATLNAGVEDALGSGSSSDGRGATSWYLGATVPTPITKLKLGVAFDYYDDHNSGAGNSSDDSIWVAGLYATYQATDKLSLSLRAEYLNEDGVSLNDVPGVDYGWSYRHNDSAEEVTATAQYQLWANVLSRVEFRWDHLEHGKAFDNVPVGYAPAHDNAYMLALNLIYQF
jgi:hypothetical protein